MVKAPRSTGGAPPEAIALLDAHPDPAVLLDLDYRIVAANAAYREIYGGEVSTTPHRCFEVSHGYDAPCDQSGESCPLRTTLETGRVSRVMHVHHTPRGEEHVDVETRP
ncbi:MAG TPA: PAS domain-containing protein, partial [Thioalkalivibrio sp.]|nr:PAS domain-containing protein [Thioalkalivibrio sp.]